MPPLTRTVRRATSRRRGLSVVLTSLLLVVAVALMGSFLIAWGNNTFASQEAIIANQSSSRINQAQESLVVEDAWFFKNATNSYATVTVRNSGSVGIVVSSIAVNTSLVWSKGVTIPIASYSQITFPSGWKSGDTQSLWVTTQRGSQITSSWKS